MKVKVHTGVEQAVYDEISVIARVQHDGNFSLALRLIIIEGLKSYGKPPIPFNVTFKVDGDMPQ